MSLRQPLAFFSFFPHILFFGKKIWVKIRAEAYTLTELAKENQLSQYDLVHQLNLAKSTVSRLVDKLVKRGWIQRERSQEDGRVWLLSLTEAGVETAVTLSQARQTKFAQILTHIPESEQENVMSALETLIQAVRQSSG